MPTNDFISNILEIKDPNLLNVESSNTELHVHFKLETSQSCLSKVWCYYKQGL